MNLFDYSVVDPRESFIDITRHNTRYWASSITNDVLSLVSNLIEYESLSLSKDYFNSTLDKFVRGECLPENKEKIFKELDKKLKLASLVIRDEYENATLKSIKSIIQLVKDCLDQVSPLSILAHEVKSEISNLCGNVNYFPLYYTPKDLEKERYHPESIFEITPIKSMNAEPSVYNIQFFIDEAWQTLKSVDEMLKESINGDRVIYLSGIALTHMRLVEHRLTVKDIEDSLSKLETMHLLKK